MGRVYTGPRAVGTWIDPPDPPEQVWRYVDDEDNFMGRVRLEGGRYVCTTPFNACAEAGTLADAKAIVERSYK